MLAVSGATAIAAIGQTRVVRQVPIVPPADRTRILIADDDRLFGEMLRSALSAREEFEVVGVVDNGADAVARTKSLKPALVLMDVAMPIMDGIEATRQIRKLPDAPAVVLITGEESESDRRAYEAGASAYLRKSAELVAVIDVVVAVSQLNTTPV
jgi:DNA-binding NarL/FixJ family response regulator